MKSEMLYTTTDGNDNPIISFIIPTYKNTRYLPFAIDSIINQNIPFSFEIIVISNNPEDDLKSIINRYKDNNEKIVFYRNFENYGQVGNINQGVSLAKGKYISFVHDDDMITNNYAKVIKKYVCDEEKEYSCIIPSVYMKFENYRFDLKHRFLNVIYLVRYLYRKDLTLIKPLDGLYAYDDVYSAPTCGTIFLKRAIEQFGYFKDKRGAAWDFYNYRLFNNDFDVYLLHKYLGIRRTETGMSKEAKVVQEFIFDKHAMLNDNRNNRFVKRFGNCLISGQPQWKYFFIKVITGSYKYLHNLDSKRPISRAMFDTLKKRENNYDSQVF